MSQISNVQAAGMFLYSLLFALPLIGGRLARLFGRHR